MDDELRAALELTREELHAMWQAAEPASVAQVNLREEILYCLTCSATGLQPILTLTGIDRFRSLNDRVWGAGNWMECSLCLDGRGNPSFHHRNFHT